MKKEKFDGITRPSTDTYRKRWDEIFKPKTLHEELMEGFEKEWVEKVLNIDTSRYEVAVIVALGYRVKEQPPRKRHPMENIVEYR